MNEKNLAVILGSSLSLKVREFVGKALESVERRLNDFDERIKSIPAGPKGEKGDPGESITGPQGEPGLSIIGPKGEDGQSIVGPQGEPGTPGKDGESIKGDKGDTGERGERGEMGPQGEKGEPGLTIKGDPGERGEKGMDGRDGREGKDGLNGADGRDALQLDIIPAILESKSYPRGTYAKYKGGIVRSIRQTDPIGEDNALERGWECIVEGLARMSITQGEEYRSVKVEMRSTGGTTEVTTLYYPILLDKGIWKVGNEFTQGDVVSHDGSMWICQAEKTANQPGNGSSDWRLSVKRGRDGKDLTDRKDAPPNGPVRLK